MGIICWPGALQFNVEEVEKCDCAIVKLERRIGLNLSFFRISYSVCQTKASIQGLRCACRIGVVTTHQSKTEVSDYGSVLQVTMFYVTHFAIKLRCFIRDIPFDGDCLAMTNVLTTQLIDLNCL